MAEIIARGNKSAKRIGYNGRVLFDEPNSFISCRNFFLNPRQVCLRSKS